MSEPTKEQIEAAFKAVAIIKKYPGVHNASSELMALVDKATAPAVGRLATEAALNWSGGAYGISDLPRIIQEVTQADEMRRCLQWVFENVRWEATRLDCVSMRNLGKMFQATSAVLNATAPKEDKS